MAAPPSFALHVGGALVAQCATTLLVRAVHTPTVALARWYRELGASAVALDVLSLAVGTYVGARLAGTGAGLARLAGAAVAVQLAHDALFGAALSLAADVRGALPLFRAYAAEKGGGAILRDDALMMVGATVAARALARLAPDDAAAVAATAAYANLLLALGL